MRPIFAVFSFLAGTYLGTAPATAAFVCPHLEDAAQRAMSGWQVPGMAIAVIADGKRSYRRTFGVADADSSTPVTEKTLFGIGSITKSMTALGFAISDARRELPLATPVKSVLPYFPGGITIRHLLSHTAGWPRHDALWYLNAYDRHTLPAKLSSLPRFSAPGSAFQYNNVPFAAVGEVVTEFANVSWDYWIRAVILEPAGMAHAMTRLSVFRNSPARATPYFPAREGRIQINLRDTAPVAPAAGLYATIGDMTLYTAALATDGVIDGRRIFPAKAVRKLREPTSRGYGLGLRLGQWRGRDLVFHPGFIDGYGARISVLPGSGSGVVVLSNLSGETPVARIVSQIALDCLTDGPETDWIARFGHRRPPPKPEAPLPAPRPVDRNLASYAGSFEHNAYGRIAFTAAPDGGMLIGAFHGRNFKMSYAGNDRWRLHETHWPLREGLLFSFDGLANERFSAVAAPLADGPSYRHNAGPIRFTRLALPSRTEKPD